MFQKHKKLIYSQICAVLAIVSLILGALRHSQTQDWAEQMTFSFLLFAALLFVAELKFIRDWLHQRKTLAEQ
jgi:hypothetical protein